MKISRRIFITLMGTTTLVGVITIAYFVLLLPGLYTEAKEQEYLKSTESFHRIVTQESFSIENPPTLGNLQAFTFQIPRNGYTITIYSTNLQTTIEINDPSLQASLDSLRDLAINMNKTEDMNVEALFDELDVSVIEQYFIDSGFTQLMDVVSIETNDFAVDDQATTKQMITSDEIAIIGSRIHSNSGTYSGYIAISSTDANLFFTVTSAATPDLSELRPIVLNSVPMIAGLLILVAIFSSTVLSKYLGKPVEILAHQAEHFDVNNPNQFKQPNTGDEFKTLEKALNSLSNELSQSLAVLSVQNEELSRAKSRQELFIMNATHQLKTPLSSASLLIQGYLDGVGQYKDPMVTLPKVLVELKKMNELIHTSLNISVSPSKEPYQAVNISNTIGDILAFYNPKITDKHLEIVVSLEQDVIHTDPQYFIPSLENILSNAIKYSPTGARISINENAGLLSICNEDTVIDPTILPHIKDPFVRGHTEKESGTGLGLYLVDTFLNHLDILWTIRNTEQGVCVTLNIGDYYDNH